MMKLLFATALVVQGIAATSSLPAQVKQESDIRVTRAVYGSAVKSADVTPVVTRLVAQGTDEFYVSPRWLEIDPSAGQPKTLVVFYEYLGAPHVLSATDLRAVSETILIEHADSTMRPRPIANLTSGIYIVHAYYGLGRSFQDITTFARDAIRPRRPEITVSDSALKVAPAPGYKALLITYLYRGTTNSWFARAGAPVSHDLLVAHAEAAAQTQKYSNAPPAWLEDVTPVAAHAAGSVGRATQRELGIFQLLRAVVELDSIPESERTVAVTRAIDATRKALTNAQESLGYPYPAPNAPPLASAKASTNAHIARAIQALTSSVTEFSASNPGRGRGRGPTGSMPVILASINEALAALREK